MATVKMISLKEYCEYNQVDVTFIEELETHDIIRLERVKRTKYVPINQIPELERAIRISRDLSVNSAGISAIFSLLRRIAEKDKQLTHMRRRLSFYERNN